MRIHDWPRVPLHGQRVSSCQHSGSSLRLPDFLRDCGQVPPHVRQVSLLAFWLATSIWGLYPRQPCEVEALKRPFAPIHPRRCTAPCGESNLRLPYRAMTPHSPAVRPFATNAQQHPRRWYAAARSATKVRGELLPFPATNHDRTCDAKHHTAIARCLS